MKKHTCSFVSGAEMFKGLSALWSHLCESDSSFSWGGNNRSLVTASSILDHFDNTVMEGKTEKQCETFRSRAEEIGMETYVDLEN